MPTIMHTSESVEDLFKRNVEARGLSLDETPQAVQMAIILLQQVAMQSPFVPLLNDLPSEARAWDWMSCAFSAYAEFCDRTVVVNDGAPESGD